MKVAWIFPIEKRCGISFYSHEYVRTLAKFAAVEIFDIEECLAATKVFADKLNLLDIIHIQYETSFFLKRNNKRYKQLCNQITKPIVVSLHEVYDNFPGVFPRSQIKGRGFIRKCKEYIYDIRHYYQTVYTQHLSHSFFADVLLVHADYHKDILVKQGIQKDKVMVIPHPVKVQNSTTCSVSIKSDELNLSSLGFINQNYNYPLLFEVLDKLKIPWHFTWIGGIRRNEDIYILRAIKQDILKRNWEDKFFITGWVPDKKRDMLLSQTDIYLALFSARSSSGSLATALGARKLIVATSLPFIRELIKDSPMMSVTQANSNAVIESINNLISDNNLRNAYLNEIDKYIKQHSFKVMSENLMEVYKELAA